MSVDRSLRSTFAAILLIAALFVAMNRIVASAPLADWWLPLVLFIIGVALVPNWNFSRDFPVETTETPEETPALPGDVRTYRISAQQVPRLHTMTIRPDPEASDTVVTITEDTPHQGDLLPFMDTEVVESSPAPAPTFASRTEAVDMDNVVAKQEVPPPPLPDDSITATPRTEPEKEVIAEKMAAPQQAYEAAQVGTITPAQVEAVMDDSTSAGVPLVTETASPAITAQERDGVGSVGSADDLTKLNGIGPKSAAALKAAGIDSFQKLANSSEDQLRAAVAGVRLVGDVTTWPHQAAYAARGDWPGLTEYNAQQRKSAPGD